MAPLQPTLFDGACDDGDIGRIESGAGADARKRRGHYPTPPELVERVIVSKRRAAEYKAARDAGWGDAWPPHPKPV